jgi:hypothetical protein
MHAFDYQHGLLAYMLQICKSASNGTLIQNI